MYDIAKEEILNGDLDWENDTFGMLLLKSAGVDAVWPRAGLNPTVAAVLAQSGTEEQSGGTYARQTLTNTFIRKATESVGGRAWASSDPVKWEGLTFTSGLTQYFLIYKDGATDALRIPVVMSIITSYTPDGTDFEIFPSGSHGWWSWT